MALLTTLAIIAGVTLVVGGGAVAVGYYATEEERARARIAEINSEISNCNTIISAFDNIKTKLVKSKEYLSDAKKDFTNGGWVQDGTPLANKEFKSCNSDIESAIGSIDNIINYYRNAISELNKEKRECEAKLD